MNTYQKIAALIFRLVAIGLIAYSFISGFSAFMFMPAMIWYVVPFVVAGVVLFAVSIPLAKIITIGFDE